MKRLFKMDDNTLTETLDQQALELKAQGMEPEIIASIQLTLPLLIENQAISRYIQQSNQPYLRNSLPELLTVSEAVILATEEYRLSLSQSQQLKNWLNKETKRLLPPKM